VNENGVNAPCAKQIRFVLAKLVVFYPGAARCGRSAGCVLCALWAVTAAVLGGRYAVGVSIPSSPVELPARGETAQ